LRPLRLSTECASMLRLLFAAQTCTRDRQPIMTLSYCQFLVGMAKGLSGWAGPGPAAP
jgi:hypothetical protein